MAGSRFGAVSAQRCHHVAESGRERPGPPRGRCQWPDPLRNGPARDLPGGKRQADDPGWAKGWYGEHDSLRSRRGAVSARWGKTVPATGSGPRYCGRPHAVTRQSLTFCAPALPQRPRTPGRRGLSPPRAPSAHGLAVGPASVAPAKYRKARSIDQFSTFWWLVPSCSGCLSRYGSDHRPPDGSPGGVWQACS